jgi:hypothetical protein
MSKFTLFLAAVLAAMMTATPAIAQDNTRNWDNGNIVAVTEVHIKPGMFNAYINDLNNVWRRFNEEQMKDGSVVTYAMFANTSPREGEPDLYLTVTYPNWATFDRGEEYWDSIRDKVIGSADDMRSAGMKREELRTIGSEYMLRQIKFRK